MLTRSAILLFVVAVLIFGYRIYRDWSKDIDLPEAANTAGHISAIRLLEDGSQVVVFDADGNLIESPGYTPGKNDKDAVWRPDGNRLFFVSDREENAQNIYRWNFGAKAVSRRTYNSRTKGLPNFLPGDPTSKTALITSGPFVLEFDPAEAVTRQVLPPISKERVAVDTESGAGGQFDAVYRMLGQSFREAKWTPDKSFVVAIMRRDVGEALIVQDLRSDTQPVPIAAGDRIEFDIDPKTGRIVFLVLNFQLLDPSQAPPEMIKNGRIVLPFRHLIAMADPALLGQKAEGVKATVDIARSNSDRAAFHALSISPDGSRLVVVGGAYDPGRTSVAPDALVVMPLQESGAQAASVVLREKVYEPSWHPNGETLAFIRYNAKGQRAIFKVQIDGTGLTEVSKDAGDFAFPRFSPQTGG